MPFYAVIPTCSVLLFWTNCSTVTDRLLQTVPLLPSVLPPTVLLYLTTPMVCFFITVSTTVTVTTVTVAAVTAAAVYF